MPRHKDPNSRTTPVTIKVTRSEADMLRRIGGSPGKGLRKILADASVATLFRKPKEGEE